MKVLFAVSNEKISEAIVKKYQKDYKEIISYKNVYYFNAILKEIQRDKTYDRIVISEDLEPFANNDYDAIDKFIFEKLDNISDEATDREGGDTPIILICSDRRAKSEQLLVKLFGIGVYDALLGQDRSIQQVCELIKKPRSKKEAKIYYKIESEDVGYQSENDETVSEVEIQNILMHYKKLGKDENAYIESFNRIAAQYTDMQLKLIIRLLPINVKAVLETQCPKYQELMAFSGTTAQAKGRAKKEEDKQEKLKINFIENQLNKEKTVKQVIVPSAVNTTNVRKLGRKVEEPRVQPQVQSVQQPQQRTIQQAKPVQEEVQPISPNLQRDLLQEFEEEPIQKMAIPEETSPIVEEIPEIEEIPTIEMQRPQENVPEIEEIPQVPEIPQVEEVAEPPKRKRGRPRKIQDPQEVQEEKPKRKRGRPRKVDVNAQNEELTPVATTDVMQNQPTQPEQEVEDILGGILPGFDEIEEDSNLNTLPGLEEVEETSNDTMLPGFDEIEEMEETQEAGILPGFDDIEEEPTIPQPIQHIPEPELPRTDLYTSNNDSNLSASYDNNGYGNYNATTDLASTMQSNGNRIENLLTKDKKVVAFVGTTKNGTSFIVNTLAQVFSDMGIKTAILDVTKNKNAYYIYTKNEEQLRNVAMSSITNLEKGITGGIPTTKNLTVYTSLPTEPGEEDYNAVLETLVRNYSLVLIDCDFDTPVEYFSAAQEIYLVQSMDILTIQPLTAFLRELKAKNVLDTEKLRVIINKATKVRALNPKIIIGGISYYNDPAMSFITELLDKDRVKYSVIPFDEQAYIRYLEGIVECKISLNGYPKNFMKDLKELANHVFPLLSNKYKPVDDYKPRRIK